MGASQLKVALVFVIFVVEILDGIRQDPKLSFEKVIIGEKGELDSQTALTCHSYLPEVIPEGISYELPEVVTLIQEVSTRLTKSVVFCK